MWRAFFLAIGISLFILGAECLLIEEVTLTRRAAAGEPQGFAQPLTPAQRVVTPPEWAPWSLLSAGAVVVLYSFSIPRRVAG